MTIPAAFAWLVPEAEVLYRPDPTMDLKQAEHGTVVRWNGGETLVFVLFDGDTTAKACPPHTLTRVWISKNRKKK